MAQLTPSSVQDDGFRGLVIHFLWFCLVQPILFSFLFLAYFYDTSPGYALGENLLMPLVGSMMGWMALVVPATGAALLWIPVLLYGGRSLVTSVNLVILPALCLFYFRPGWTNNPATGTWPAVLILSVAAGLLTAFVYRRLHVFALLDRVPGADDVEETNSTADGARSDAVDG